MYNTWVEYAPQNTFYFYDAFTLVSTICFFFFVSIESLDEIVISE